MKLLSLFPKLTELENQGKIKRIVFTGLGDLLANTKIPDMKKEKLQVICEDHG